MKALGRRFAIVLLGMVLLAALLDVFSGGSRSGHGVSQPSSSSPLYQPDPGWQLLPVLQRRQFETWHSLFTHLERTGQQELGRQYLASIMALPGGDSVKRLMGVFVADTQRVPYIEALIGGVNPQVSDSATRELLLLCLNRLYLANGSGAFSKGVRAIIDDYRDSRVETDPGASLVLDRLAGNLGL